MGNFYIYTPAGDTLPDNFPTEGGGGGGGGGGTTNYNDLSNKPTLGGVTLQGSVTLAQVGAATTTRVNSLATDVAEAVSKAEAATTKATEATTDMADVKNDIQTINNTLATVPTEAIPNSEIDTDWED